MHTTSKIGLDLIKSFEGFSSKQYDDGTGVMTIGYGTTSADISPLPTFLTEVEASTLLAKKLREKYEPAVHALHLHLNQNQFDALVSVAYNLGPHIFDESHDIGKALHSHNLTAVPRILLEYDDPGTPEQAGLLRRRQAEAKLFSTRP